MFRLLYLECSPRGEDSVSTQAATAYLEALPDAVTVTRLRLFEQPLPDFDAELAEAKYAVMFGRPLTDAQSALWSQVEARVAELKSADQLLFSVPMWNFGIPYKLKHYIDFVNHMGLTFTRTADGPEGLVKASAVLVYARGGDYSSKDGKPDPFDYQSTYMRTWLGSIGVTAIEEVLVQRTLAGPEQLQDGLEAARKQLEALAGAS